MFFPRNYGRMTALLLVLLTTGHAAESSPLPFHESFGPDFDAKRFTTPIPNKNIEVRDGVLWMHGSSGGMMR